MGGGDLNLKKSWHPSTLRNIEKVWKAEQKHNAEQNKIEQLQKELQDERGREEIQSYAEDKGVVEKKSSRLDWMYAGPAAMVDRDDYLLGRQVDKTFEVMDLHSQGLMKEDENEASQPGALFSNKASVSVDLTNKVQLDPLFAIKKKEQQAKKDILRNPVKMKQLQKYLEETVEKSHKKKNKKKKKKKSKSSDDSDDESDRKRRRKHRKSRDQDTKQFKKPRADYSKHEDEDRSSKNRKERSDKHEHRRDSRKYRHRSRSVSDDDAKNQRRPSSHSSKKRHDSSSDEEPKPKKFGLIGGHKKRNVSPDGRVDYSKIKLEKPQVKPTHNDSRRKLTAEEIENRRLEMMDNAKWRDDQRNKNVQRYREESEKEVEDHHKQYESSFIIPMLSKAAESGSVEARIKSNKYKIQRSSNDINKNFARR